MTLVFAALCVRLGFWQLDRAAAKQALRAEVAARAALPPLAAAALAATPEAAAAQHYRRVTLAGRWLADRTVALDNRQVDGRPGFVLVTPLVLADGSAVAVQRGWLPRDAAERSRIAAPPLPAALVQVAGQLAPPPSRLFAFGADAPGAAIRQNLDLGAWSAEIGVPLRPLSLVQLDGPRTPSDGLRREMPLPSADVSRHQVYAGQWFLFAALAVVLYVGLLVFRARRPR
uniref:SURF1-like protein n=1 Tax=Rubrivivax gelatinosus TaxID=28068 RepID=Q5GCB6_RUBGE|nr:SurF1 [Rubrivivax gelatinosus]